MNLNYNEHIKWILENRGWCVNNKVNGVFGISHIGKCGTFTSYLFGPDEPFIKEWLRIDKHFDIDHFVAEKILSNFRKGLTLNEQEIPNVEHLLKDAKELDEVLYETTRDLQSYLYFTEDLGKSPEEFIREWFKLPNYGKAQNKDTVKNNKELDEEL